MTLALAKAKALKALRGALRGTATYLQEQPALCAPLSETTMPASTTDPESSPCTTMIRRLPTPTLSACGRVAPRSYIGPKPKIRLVA